MKSNKNVPFVPYTPSPEELALACGDFVEVHQRENGGITEVEFGRRLADDILIETAISEGLDEVPDLGDEGELWKLYEQRVKLGAKAVSKCVECPLYETCSGASSLRLEAGIVTPDQEERRETLFNIARKITSGVKGVVLKGGFAMTLYGINRSTDDVDFDTFKPLTDKEKEVLETIYLEAGGSADSPKRDTDTTFRYTIEKKNGPNPGQNYPLKIEIKNKETAPEDSDDITTIDGIRVYKPHVVLRHKLKTSLERSKGRDMVDVSYLLSYFPETIETVDADLLEKVLTRMESNSTQEDGAVGLGDLEAEANRLALPVWLQDTKVLGRMLTETRDRIRSELDKRTANQ